MIRINTLICLSILSAIILTLCSCGGGDWEDIKDVQETQERQRIEKSIQPVNCAKECRK